MVISSFETAKIDFNYIVKGQSVEVVMTVGAQVSPVIACGIFDEKFKKLQLHLDKILDISQEGKLRINWEAYSQVIESVSFGTGRELDEILPWFVII